MEGWGHERYETIVADYISPTVVAFAEQVNGRVTKAGNDRSPALVVELPTPFFGINGRIYVVVNPWWWRKHSVGVATQVSYEQGDTGPRPSLEPVEIPFVRPFDLEKLVKRLEAAKAIIRETLPRGLQPAYQYRLPISLS